MTDILRYTETNEDLRIIEAALELKRGEVFAGVGGGGDVLFWALTKSPKKVWGFEQNFAQIAWIYLRQVAFAKLTLEEYLVFFGLKTAWIRSEELTWPGEKLEKFREKIYARLSEAMPVSVKNFWNRRINVIRGGAVDQASFPQKVLKQKLAFQKTFSDKNDFRNFIGFGPLNSRQRLFRKKKKEIVKTFPNDLRPFAEKLIFQGEIENPSVARLFLGFIPEKFAPEFLTPRGFLLVKANIERLTVIHNDFTAGLNLITPETVDCIYGSNIVDYMKEEEVLDFSNAILRVSKLGCRVLLFYRKTGPRIPFSLFLELSGKSKELEKKEAVGTLRGLSLLIKKQ